ncbi:MAG: hypothetical protein WAL73_18615, partial [Terracidiphilus sp.]
AASAPSRKAGVHTAPPHVPAGPLTGSLALVGLSITGDSISHPIAVARTILEPGSALPDQHPALVAAVSVPAGSPTPLAVRARLSLSGFQLGLHGPVSIARLREFAHFAGGSAQASLSQLAGEPASIDLESSGPWVPPVEVTLGASSAPPPSSVHLSGAITFRDANWKPSFLANAVLIHQATLRLDNGAMNWGPVQFSYGPVKGSATLALPAACTPPADCAPRFTAHFSTLDTAEMQGALLGARQKGTLLSSLLDRFNPSATPAWPAAEGSVEIDSLSFGPFVAQGITANIKIAGSGVELTSFDAALLGGTLNGKAALQAGDKPQYSFDASFTGLKPALVGALLGMKWSGGSFSGSGKLRMSGFTDKDLAASANGALEFDWRKGGMKGAEVPVALAGFDRFSGSADFASGAVSVRQDMILRGKEASTVRVAASLAIPHKIAFSSAKH